MKNLFYVLAAGFLLASCTTDSTCTCTYDAITIDGVEITAAYSDVTECIGCNSEETEAFEQLCTDLDDIITVSGLSGSCVID